MPLYRVMAYAGNACTDGVYDNDLTPKYDEFLVHAKDAERARAVVVRYLVSQEAYSQIEVFANPRLSMCERVKARAPEGIESVYHHHCKDHS